MSIDTIVDDQGNEYRSKMTAAQELVRRPEAYFFLERLSMGGVVRDAYTAEIRRFVKYVVADSNGASDD